MSFCRRDDCVIVLPLLVRSITIAFHSVRRASQCLPERPRPTVRRSEATVGNRSLAAGTVPSCCSRRPADRPTDRQPRPMGKRRKPEAYAERSAYLSVGRLRQPTDAVMQAVLNSSRGSLASIRCTKSAGKSTCTQTHTPRRSLTAVISKMMRVIMDSQPSDHSDKMITIGRLSN